MQPVKTWPAGCNAVVEMCKIFHSKFASLMGGMCIADRGSGGEGAKILATKMDKPAVQLGLGFTL